MKRLLMDFYKENVMESFFEKKILWKVIVK